jgi:hypothetical protein
MPARRSVGVTESAARREMAWRQLRSSSLPNGVTVNDIADRARPHDLLPPLRLQGGGDFLAVDPARDSRPYLLAANWYRSHVRQTGEMPGSAEAVRLPAPRPRNNDIDSTILKTNMCIMPY